VKIRDSAPGIQVPHPMLTHPTDPGPLCCAGQPGGSEYLVLSHAACHPLWPTHDSRSSAACVHVDSCKLMAHPVKCRMAPLPWLTEGCLLLPRRPSPSPIAPAPRSTPSSLYQDAQRFHLSRGDRQTPRYAPCHCQQSCSGTSATLHAAHSDGSANWPAKAAFVCLLTSAPVRTMAIIGRLLDAAPPAVHVW
jgi:hypothetical protein